VRRVLVAAGEVTVASPAAGCRVGGGFSGGMDGFNGRAWVEPLFEGG
jgi:hypothetical protein